MTIEWVLDHLYGVVLRLDLVREQGSNPRMQERVAADFFFTRGDEEGSFLGYLGYRSDGHRPGPIDFRYSGSRSEWTTMVGDVIASWDQQWRTESGSVCRLGERREDKRTIWQNLTPTHLLVIEHLAMQWGVIEHFSSSQDANARFVLGAVTDRLRGIIAKHNDEVKSRNQGL